VRVPLMIKVPGAKPRRIDLPRSQIDLAPTIAELMGAKPPDSFVGKSLAAEIRGSAPDDREPIVLDQPEDTLNPKSRAIVEGGYKLTAIGDRFLLFDLGKDPAEERDLSKREPGALARMKKRLGEVSASIPEIEPYGEMKLVSGRVARGNMEPAPSR